MEQKSLKDVLVALLTVCPQAWGRRAKVRKTRAPEYLKKIVEFQHLFKYSSWHHILKYFFLYLLNIFAKLRTQQKNRRPMTSRIGPRETVYNWFWHRKLNFFHARQVYTANIKGESCDNMDKNLNRWVRV